jgi:hypothetical protein
MKTAGYIALAFIFLGMTRRSAPAVSPAPGAVNQANTTAAQIAAAAAAAIAAANQPSPTAPFSIDASGDMVQIIGSTVDNTGVGNTGGLGITGSD